MQPGHRFFIRSINRPHEKLDEKEWAFQYLFSIETDIMEKYEAIPLFIKEAVIPHPVHQHPQEELLIPLTGTVELLGSFGKAHASPEPKHLPSGSLIYYPANEPHSLRAKGPESTVVLGIRWQGGQRTPSDKALGTTILDIPEMPASAGENTPAFNTVTLLKGETGYTRRMEIQHLLISPKGACRAHLHDHDLLLILLDGSMNAMAAKVSAPAVLFFQAGTPHWMENPGETPVSLLSVEFE